MVTKFDLELEKPVLLRNNQVVFQKEAGDPNVKLANKQKTFPTWNSLGRPRKPKPGTIGFNFEKSRLEFWTGTVWASLPMKRLGQK